MNRFVEISIRVVLALAWFCGLMAGLFSDDIGSRVVGMLLWIGLGVGYRLHEIQKNTAAKQG